jgi:hypothetical protein
LCKAKIFLMDEGWCKTLQNTPLSWPCQHHLSQQLITVQQQQSHH